MSQSDIIVSRDKLELAKQEGCLAELELLQAAINEKIGGELTAETMPMLNGEQITLLAYLMFREEMLEGGVVQLIHNGLGGFIFENPFAKAMRLWGVKDMTNLVYSARPFYMENKEELTRDCTDEEFMALYEQHPEFEKIDDEFIDEEPRFTAAVAAYVDAHLELFVKVE